MSEPAVAASVAELLDGVRGSLRVAGGRVAIDDAAVFRARGIRDLAWTATFSDDPATVEAARWLGHQQAPWGYSARRGAPIS